MATINFKGKEIVRNHHLTIPYHELVPDAKKSLSNPSTGSGRGKPSLNDNLIIHGDNLLALKALLPTYAGKVKCIYIDPPYNTGNEKWAYNDNVNSPMMRDWLGKVVDKDDLTRHDKWLCMMMPRLKLLRELLRDDGVIFMSIDDSELGNLRLLVDEVFGEENFIEQFVIRSNPRGNQAKKFTASVHEYILLYAKSKNSISPLGFQVEEENYEKVDEEGRKYREIGLRKRGAGARREDAPNQYFPIYFNPNSGKISLSQIDKHYIKILPKLSDGSDGRWRWAKNTIEEEKDNLIVRLVRRNGTEEYDVFEKDYHYVGKISKITSIFYEKEVNYENATEELKEIFGKKVFDYPKPAHLVKKIIQSLQFKEGYILDSFAGTGTTAHATLALNREDGGNRKFILVEMEDYADKITAERVRRVIKGVKGAKDENLQKGLGGSFSYYELGKPIDTERILKGKDLPTFAEMARYIFYTATGEEFNGKKINEKTGFIGESKEYQVYLLYKPDMEYLKSIALTLERAETLGKFTGKKRLVFAPAKYLDQEHLKRYHIDFAQLPFEIYKKQ